MRRRDGRGVSRVAASPSWLSSLLACSLRTNSERFRLYALPDFANRIGIYLRPHPRSGWAPHASSRVVFVSRIRWTLPDGKRRARPWSVSVTMTLRWNRRDMPRQSVPRGLPAHGEAILHVRPSNGGGPRWVASSGRNNARRTGSAGIPTTSRPAKPSAGASVCSRPARVVAGS